LLIQVPIDCDSIFFQKRTHKFFGTAGSGDEFGEDRRGDYEASAMKSRV
jgi:hypothetical protein